MYIMITDIVVEKRIDLAYLIRNLDSSEEVTYQIRKPFKVLLITNEENQLPEGVFTDRELNASIRWKLITTPMDTNDKIVKMDKLACVMEIVLSL